MNKAETAKLLAVVSAAHPAYPVTTEQITVYAELLEDLSFEESLAAVKDLLMTNDRWLSAAQIRRKVAERAGALAPSKTEAWGEVMKQINKHGASGRPEFSHPLIEEVVRAFGWRTLCLSENVDTTRAHFLKSYEESMVKRNDDVLRNPGRIALEARVHNALPRPVPALSNGATHE